MSLTKDDVEKIAHLARIQLSDADIPEYTRNLSNILDFVAQMQRVDTHNITPMAHPLEASARLRTDLATETNQRDAYQTIAPQTEAGLYLVPKVIE